MKYFIDTHDKAKGSFPAQVLTEEQFFAQQCATFPPFHVLSPSRHRRFDLT